MVKDNQNGQMHASDDSSTASEKLGPKQAGAWPESEYLADLKRGLLLVIVRFSSLSYVFTQANEFKCLPRMSRSCLQI